MALTYQSECEAQRTRADRESEQHREALDKLDMWRVASGEYQRECERFRKAWSDEGLRRDRETARANAAEQRAEKAEADANRWGERMSHMEERAMQAERERDEARAELAAVKAQKPVCFVRLNTMSGGYDVTAGFAPGDKPVYAAPVPPPDCISKAQHKAALAQARRDERERIAEEAITQSSLRLGSKRLPSIVMAETDADVVRADTEGRILAWFAAAIRALPDAKEGE